MPEVKRFYTGVGSRETPEDCLTLIQFLAVRLASEGWVLRSGHCVGADRAFESGAGGEAEIYLPWRGYGVRPYRDDPGRPVSGKVMHTCDYDIIACYDELVRLGVRYDCEVSRACKLLHGRNYCQVMGECGGEGPVSEFLVCWAREAGGEVQGGTATAVNLARLKGVPVWNLYVPAQRKAVTDYVRGRRESLTDG